MMARVFNLRYYTQKLFKHKGSIKFKFNLFYFKITWKKISKRDHVTLVLLGDQN
jgi:hypothetical protein